MHNISTPDIPPAARRRCASEGKRGKSRPRPVSAVIYPTNRGRSDTEPSSPQSLFHASSSTSTRNLSENESPRSKTSVLNRLLPRRRSKEGITIYGTLSGLFVTFLNIGTQGVQELFFVGWVSIIWDLNLVTEGCVHLWPKLILNSKY